MMLAARSALAMVLCGLAAACHSDSAPDLGRLYASGMEPARTPPVILIPGALGSRLLDSRNGTEVWPGSTLHLLAGSKQDLVLPFDPVTLEPVDDGLAGSPTPAADAYLYELLVRSGGVALHLRKCFQR